MMYVFCLPCFADDDLDAKLHKTGIVNVTRNAYGEVKNIELIINSYIIAMDAGSKSLEAMDGQKVRVSGTFSMEGNNRLFRVVGIETDTSQKIENVATAKEQPQRDQKIQAKNEQTRNALHQPESIKEVNIADLIDNTEKYKGKTITLILTLNSDISGNSLRDNVGFDVPFYTFGEKHERLDIIISIPKNLDVPKAVFLDKLSVTFRCKEGNINQGNEAVLITRP